MSRKSKPFILTEIRGLVFDTNEYEQPWYDQDPYAGVPVDIQRLLDELAAHCFFVIPENVTEEDPPFDILTVAKGRPGNSVSWPSFRDPVLLRDERGGIYLQVTYHPQRHEFHAKMNAGGDHETLAGVILEGASPGLIRGRILALEAEISLGRLYASVNDRFMDGDIEFEATVRSTGKPFYPWGGNPSGHWFISSGQRDARHDGASSLPVGFGLSDLRITLVSESNTPLDPLPYLGALDHLVEAYWEVEDRFDPDELASSLSEETLPESLFHLAKELDWMYGDARRWAERARGLAQETEHLAMQLPEDFSLGSSGLYDDDYY